MSKNVISPSAWVSPHYHISSCLLSVGSIKVNTDVFLSNGYIQGEIEGIFRDAQETPLLHFGK